MLHGRVSPDVVIELKSKCSTRPHTRACDRSCGTSQYALQFWHGLIHERVWLFRRAHGRVVRRVTQVCILSSFYTAWHTGLPSVV
ncbi:hypothetical protein F383_25385 [Gossypium arboreum]|uniref:Uncharacterized protein n=1 Tax=Gossypium arboreum TaxID=29729 RepID=A0A0B0P2R7_GOSAR|nr:hypothetical protein F383_25385 [Gossypium arboreum]